MFVEVREIKDGRPKNVCVKNNPYDIVITIGDAQFGVAESFKSELLVSVDGNLVIVPVGNNMVRLRFEPCI